MNWGKQNTSANIGEFRWLDMGGKVFMTWKQLLEDASG